MGTGSRSRRFRLGTDLPAVLAVLLACAGATACQRGGSPGRDIFSGDPDPGQPYQSPNFVSGANRGGGRPDAPDPARARAEEERLAARARENADQAKAAARRDADALWDKAERARDPEDAGDDFRKLATDHKDHPRAEEARWRAAVKYVEAGEWSKALAALDTYTKEYPVNPNLAEAERLAYETALKQHRNANTGLGKLFSSDKAAFDTLLWIPERFPQGRYADDALLSLGDLYREKEDYATAALHYRSLLLRYPDSEWSFQARLRLGDVLLARDQGDPYHAGYVDLDPREPASPAALGTRPVRSCVEAALVQYETFLERIDADPGRRAEYAQDVAHARERVAECRRRLAAKDRAIAGFYAARGQTGAAEAYQRFAGNVESGRPWSAGLTSVPTPAPVVPPAPVTAPSAAPPVAPAVAPRTVPAPAPSPTLPPVVRPPPPVVVPTPPPTVPPPTVPPPTVPPPTVPPPPMPPPPPPPPPRVVPAPIPPPAPPTATFTTAPVPPGTLPPPSRTTRKAETTAP